MSRLSILLLIALISTFAQAGTTPSGTVDAMAILRNNCLSCHNAEKHKSGLLLTTRENALKGGDNGPALVPGKSGESRMIAQLDPSADPHMPPKKQLAAREIAALRKWIDDGAAWDEVALRKVTADTRPVVLHDLPASYKPVLAIAVTPDGKKLACGGGNHVYVYDVAKTTLTLSRTLEGARDVVQSLAWSRDGKYLAGGDYGRVLVWTMDSEKPVELTGLTGRVTAMQFLADGNSLIVADGATASPGRLHLCHVSPPDVGAPVPAHKDEILSIALSPDGSLLASGGADKTVRIWDASSLKEIAKFEGHTGHVTAVAFNVDGTQLASGATDKDVKVWDVKTHEQVINHGPHPVAVTSILWLAPKAKRIAVACEDGTVRLDPTEESPPGRAYAAAADVIYGIAVIGPGDAPTLLGGCHDGQIYAWGSGGLMRSFVAGAKSSEPPAGK